MQTKNDFMDNETCVSSNPLKNKSISSMPYFPGGEKNNNLYLCVVLQPQ